MSKQKQAFAEYLLDNMTWPERILWSRIRHRQIGYSFQCQAIVRGYIVDFWCAKARVAIELDGPTHDYAEKREADKRRDEFLTKSGVKVLRFHNSDVQKGMSAVLIRVWDACYGRSPITVKPFPSKGSGVRSRFAETLEMRALGTFQEDKRLKTHEENFSRRYRKNHPLSVRNRPNRRK